MPRPLPTRSSLAAALAVALVACSPALDWRELRLDDSGVLAVMPCKPSTYQRPVKLADVALTLTLRACSAGGSTWAVAHAKLADPARIGAVLHALSAAAAANVGAAATGGQAWAPPGATPNAAAVRWRVEGRLPDGRSTASHTAVFSKGLHVIQATVVGPDTGADAVETFFAGLRGMG